MVPWPEWDLMKLTCDSNMEHKHEIRGASLVDTGRKEWEPERQRRREGESVCEGEGEGEEGGSCL